MIKNHPGNLAYKHWSADWIIPHWTQKYQNYEAILAQLQDLPLDEVPSLAQLLDIPTKRFHQIVLPGQYLSRQQNQVETANLKILG